MADSYDNLELTDEHYSPTTGLTLDSHRAIFWLSPTDDTGYLTIFADNSFGSLAIDKTTCGLADGVSYNSISGDYDGDGQGEIVWHDPNTGVAVYWPQLPGCAGYSTFPIGAAKLSAFRLYGSRDSLLVYRPPNGTVGIFDVLDEESHASLSIDVDASPVLRDFDRDGCTDILWYAPHLQESELWQSNCDATFVKTLVQPPQDAYPLGYGLGHGRG